MPEISILNFADLLEKRSNEFSTARRPSDCVDKHYGRHNEVTFVFVLRLATTGIFLIVGTAHSVQKMNFSFFLVH